MSETTPRKVLVGVASGETSEAALDFAVSEALRRGVGVHLVHAVNPVLLAADPQSWTVIEDSLRRVGTDALETAAATVGARLGLEHPISTELVHGPATPALVTESERACVVVLQQPPPEERHVLTLSVTNGVTARAHVPVVAVPTGWDEHASTAPVVVGVERPDLSHEVVRVALEEARARQVPLRLVHAWRYSDAFDDLVFDPAMRSAHEERLHRALSDGLGDLLGQYGDVATEVVLRHDHAADALVEESPGAALLVLGRHQALHSRTPHLGSVVRGVLKEARCPVMVVDPVTLPVPTDDAVDASHGPVVAAVDGSPSSDSAVRKAVHEARALGAPLRLVHVVPDYLPVSPMMPLTPAELDETAESILAHSERVARVTAPRLEEIGIRMPRGSRVRGIVDASVGARLLVMGRDRSFVQRLVSGRTAAGVAERATCPVESVPPDWQDTPRFGAVLVGVRSPVDAVPLLAHAFPVAAARAARLVVLHAWKLPTGYDDIIASRVAMAEWESRTRADLEPLLEPWRTAYPEVPVEVRVVHDRPVHALVRAAEHADLLIVMRRPHLVAGGFHLGGTARAVLSAAPCAVRVVPPSPVGAPAPTSAPDEALTSTSAGGAAQPA